MRSKFYFILLLFFCFNCVANASDDQWLQASSSHFTVITNSSEKDARHLVDQFERMRWTFQKLFPKMNVDPEEPIIILAAKDARSFDPLKPKEALSKGKLDMAGYFLRSRDKNYVLVRNDANQEFAHAIIYHEYTHLLFRNYDQWMPAWLMEGIADFYQSTIIRDKDVEIGIPSASNILFLRSNRLITLKTLFQVDRNSPYYNENEKGSIFYPESWALTHMLMMRDIDQKTQKLSTYAQLVSKGKDPVLAAEEAFGDLHDLEIQLQFYVQQGNYREIVLNSTSAPIDESYYKTKQLTQNEADAYRADVMAQQGRIDDAKALLDSILKNDSDNAIANEARGTIAQNENNNALALQLYGHAFQRGYQTQGFLERYASLILSMGLDDDKTAEAKAVLRKLTQLYPKYALPFDQLAGILRFEAKHREEARKLELEAIDNDPTNLHYRLNMEGILLTLNKFEDARAVLMAAKKLFPDAGDQKQIDESLGKIDSYIAASKAPQSDQVQADSGTVTVETGDVTAANAPKHPSGPATGPKHTIDGVIRDVACNIPSQMDLSLVTLKKTFKLYNMNYFKIEFSTLNFSASDKFDPCKMDGLHAKITYAENPADTTVDGEVQSILLKK